MQSRLLMVIALWFMTGCYAYKHAGPADVATPANGSHIQVRLTQGGAAALAQRIGPQAEEVEGEVLAADRDSVRLAVREVQHAGQITTWNGEEITIPRDAIATIGQRRLSIGATALLGGLAAGTVIAAAEVFSGSGTSTGAVIPPGSGPQ
jgi:hypothetical protein